MKKKIVHILLVTTTIIFTCFLYFCYFFTATTIGSSTLLKIILSKTIGYKICITEKQKGSFLKRLSLENFTLEGIKNFPLKNIIKIQYLDIYFHSLNILKSLNFIIDNGRVFLGSSNSDPIFFYGAYQFNQINLAFYTKYINSIDILNFIPNNKIFKKISGGINDLNLKIKGTLTELKIFGMFNIHKLSFNKFSIIDAPGVINLKTKNILSAPQLYGSIEIIKGIIKSKKTSIFLKPSKIFFSGSPKILHLDIQGTATVEKTVIHISLKGTIQKPELILTSTPVLPQAKLLIMLLTGKSWSHGKDSLNQGKVSPDFAKDFMNYFFFDELTDELANKLGVDTIDITYQSKEKGINIQKNIFDKTTLSYVLEENKEDTFNPHTSQKAILDYQISEKISLIGEKGFEKREVEEDKGEGAENKVLLKYKKPI